MTTSFSSLPIIDLSLLSQQSVSPKDLAKLSTELYDVFATTGFAYLTNAPLSFDHADVFGLTRSFFQIDEQEKTRLAKKTFVKRNANTYRGYFPTQPGQQDNLKEGFEIGAATATKPHRDPAQKFDLSEPNVWPRSDAFASTRSRLETLHTELQTLSATLLSLLAVSLGKPADHFAPYLTSSLSTLRLLHYPKQPATSVDAGDIKLCCTPHTDSGILTLLHQDSTGGLEVLNAEQQWVAAPYVPNSIVVNIGDLMAKVSGGRFVATMHRVRATSVPASGTAGGIGRLSVPFFFEPGEACWVKSVDGGEGVLYGEHIRRKMGTWVEYDDAPEHASVELSAGSSIAVF